HPLRGFYLKGFTRLPRFGNKPVDHCFAGKLLTANDGSRGLYRRVQLGGKHGLAPCSLFVSRNAQNQTARRAKPGNSLSQSLCIPRFLSSPVYLRPFNNHQPDLGGKGDDRNGGEDTV